MKGRDCRFFVTPFQRLIGAFVLVAVGCGQHDRPDIQVCDPDWLSSIEQAEFESGRRKGLVTGVYATPDPGSLYGCP